MCEYKSCKRDREFDKKREEERERVSELVSLSFSRNAYGSHQHNVSVCVVDATNRLSLAHYNKIQYNRTCVSGSLILLQHIFISNNPITRTSNCMNVLLF